jgi:hypothetical protein
MNKPSRLFHSPTLSQRNLDQQLAEWLNELRTQRTEGNTLLPMAHRDGQITEETLTYPATNLTCSQFIAVAKAFHATHSEIQEKLLEIFRVQTGPLN